MPEKKFEVDVDKAPDEQPGPNPFNRWHPDIPAVIEADPGDTMRLEARDWTGRQIPRNEPPNHGGAKRATPTNTAETERVRPTAPAPTNAQPTCAQATGTVQDPLDCPL